jgi:hypothetical protein
VLDNEHQSVISFCQSQAYGGHFFAKKITAKILQCDFYWPTMFKDTYEFYKACERCQKLRALSRRNMMPLNPILIIEAFDYWGIDFIGPFPHSHENLYILLAVDYVITLVEAIPCRNNDHQTIIKFLNENILSWFGMPEPSLVMGAHIFVIGYSRT